ncbi:penicillin-binding protein activator [Lawsonia intracellularis]|uniref:Hypothetical lipoprotein n=1 Tax=Lawsonia intracellularis (strain PHE/MN1-00) TaxID=363253 RepID=Q1MQ46_LAWIP|nr:penicillin-binding protein activator [Lawsonia intracellularis]AGC50252.1 hypothetical protein LAW_00857 [Lawsonia intracellularis N343]KAA0204273.1 penicillin-binding protein activator [Lawsonia intracellularis]MBZ3892693.1 penicillin-binding protein activator [Lawsonia intracellularis]RBN33140.1 penicillin-binding protein activator [Lawsonia intracellularis]UYH52555.1 penicillin-binding protein activator [Lawsonia intracellularis]
MKIKLLQKICIILFLINYSLISGCSSTKIVVPEGNSSDLLEKTQDIKSIEDQDRNISAQAEEAWKNNNMLEAQRLYRIVVTQSNLTAFERNSAWERLIKSSIANNHFHIALEFLTQWKLSDPTANMQPVWQDSWGIAVLKSSRVQAISHAQQVWEDASLPIPLRGIAGGVLMILSPKENKTLIASKLSELYKHSDHANCMMLEQRLFTLLSNSSSEELLALEFLTGPERDFMYPWSIIILDVLRREWPSKTNRTAELLGKINYPGVFSDSSLLASAIHVAEPKSLLVDHTNILFSPGCYALVLPMSGPYSSIGWNIAKGANAAQEELISAGVDVEVVIINSEAVGWLEKLEQLPQKCIIVGGPLQAEIYAAIREKNILSNKIFFTFLPSIGEGDEGITAWRFFSSPEDQILALLRFSHELDITMCGVLYPEDGYGRKMTELFVKLAEQSGISVMTTGYNPHDTSSWSKLLANVTKTRMIGKVPVPSTPFQAVFLPDSWKNIEVLLPYLFFQGEDRLVLMGTNLWEQGLSHGEKNFIRNMDLAVFPGSWNKSTPNATAAMLIERFTMDNQEEPDFWVGLGYDFIRFSSALNIHEVNWQASQVNKSIEKAQQMDWSIAPIYWENGKAQQKLFLFYPTSSGGKLLNTNLFKKRLDAIKKRHLKRVSAAEREVSK